MKSFWLTLALLSAAANAAAELQPVEYDGYRGIWYMNQPTGDEYAYKYSGGLGTYTADHIPMAIYSAAANKTFFVYGGAVGEDDLGIMVSYYDHETKELPRPLLLSTRGTTDAHDNPALALDDAGHLYVFSSSHGRGRPSYLWRSKFPHSIQEFEKIWDTNFSYPQPWHVGGQGFLFLHTWYEGGRGLYLLRSTDGRTWGERKLISHMEEGHYQISWPFGDTIGTAFNYHPAKLGLNFRTNIYYMHSSDFGETWRNAQGELLEIPLREKQTPALVHDYEQEGLKVYLCDMNYDEQGRPMILHVVSKGWQPGPQHGPHTFRIARWTGAQWELRDVTGCDNNYDMGSLYRDGSTWRIIAPTDAGPQAYNPGGEMVIWRSTDKGDTWGRERTLTSGSAHNHTYARRPLHAHPGFLAFWADGHARQPSSSRLYFYDDEAKQVYRMPEHIPGASALAELVPCEGAPGEKN